MKINTETYKYNCIALDEYRKVSGICFYIKPELTFRSEHFSRQFVGVEEEEVARHLPHKGRFEASEEAGHSLRPQDLLSQTKWTDLRRLETLFEVRLAKSLKSWSVS